MVPRALYVLMVLAPLAFLTACASKTSELEGTPRVAEACQLRSCACVGSRVFFLGVREDTEVLWRQNGAAYCPDGFELTFAD